MIITNDYNLPQTIVNAVNSGRRPTPNRFSVTDLIGPPQIRALRMAHWDNLKEDASDRLWALLGSAVHYVLEKGAPDESISEEKLTMQIGDYTIVGITDLWHDGELSDWKVTSVYSFLLGDKPEWEAQLNCNAALYRHAGFEVKTLKIHAILRDWQKSKTLADPEYPKIAFQSVSVPLWPDTEAQTQIEAFLKDHTAPTPRPCTDTERWMRPTTYAIMSGNNKRATKVCDSEFECQAYLDIKPVKDAKIVERKGSYNRCENYCQVADFCPQWAETKRIIGKD